MKHYSNILFLFLLIFFSIKFEAIAEDINIAALFPLSGPASYIGQSSQAGTLIAVDEINASGGIQGRKINLKVEDSQTEPRIATSSYQRLLGTFKPVVTLTVLSSIGLALRPIAEKSKSLIFAQSVHPTLTNGYKYIIRNFYTIDIANEVLVKFLKKKGIKRVAVLHAEEEWGQVAFETLEKNVADFNGEIVGHESFEKTATDVRAQILRLKEKKPEIIYVLGIGTVVGNINNQMREIGLTKPTVSFLICDNGDNIVSNLAKKSLEGSYAIEAELDRTSPKALEVMEKTKNYSIPYNQNLVTQYDAINILAESFRDGNFTADQIRNFIINKGKFSGLSGEVEFTADGNSRRPLVMKQIRDGECFKID